MRNAYLDFTDPNIYYPPKIVNKAAQQQLGVILFRELPELLDLTAGEVWDFKFTEAPGRNGRPSTTRNIRWDVIPARTA